MNPDENPIWRFKYLPKTLDQVCGREKIKERLGENIKEQNFPHFLFVGPRGIGKTTIATLFAQEFLKGTSDANFRLVYSNEPLTDEEKKQVKSKSYISTGKIGSSAGETFNPPKFIEARVRPFVELKVLGGAPFKILVVKDFDLLGNDQQGFRRLMEIYGSNCRMILITTKISRIIDPIVSRCQLFLVPPVELESFQDLIKNIAQKESIDVREDVIKNLYNYCKGDISKAIDTLQLCSNEKEITLDSLYQNALGAQNDLIRSLLMMCFKGNFSRAREIARNLFSNLKYNSHEIFAKLLNETYKLPLSKIAKIQLINLISEADIRAIDGIDDDIQVSALLSKICQFSIFL